ncbi:hypothetical protein HOLleu_13263 [Holothuria leucospilota]|uniref:C2H2-type domain-containing protein n=1 Tax=Holothuria leucospilota TaxID=206669 RepID=A0A9Q1HAR1_HOLLE|nr:hypothetical protein HOLleu_13263 [Holothuria leucospilota]
MVEPVRRSKRNAAKNGAISNVSDNELLDVDAPPAVTVQGKEKTSSSPFVCDVETCLEEFASWKAFRRHSKTHKEDKPFKCDNCSSSFNVKYNLTLHKAIHQIGTPECPDCSKKFSRLATLKAHILIHEREESLICAECGDEFSLQRELKIHRMTHNPDLFTDEAVENSSKEHLQSIYQLRKTPRKRGRKPRKGYPKNVCHLCKKTFPKPSQLIRHIRIHTGEKPFKCKQCGKAFNQKGALGVHMKTHTNERHFHCDKCKLSFSQRGGLRAHYIRLHELNFQVDNPFRCEECDSAFRSLGKLNLHITQLHSSQKDVLALLRIGALQLHKQFLEEKSKAKDGTDGTLTENEPIQVDQPVNQGIEESSTYKEDGGQENETENQNNKAINDIIQQLLTLTESSSKEKNADDLSTGVDDNNASKFSIGILQQALENCGLVVSPVAETVNKEGKTAEDVVQAFTTILHSRRALSRTHTCQLCQKNFKRPCQLKRHVKSHIRKGHLSPEDADTLLGIGGVGGSKQAQGEGEKTTEDTDVNEPKKQAKTAEDVVQNFTAIVQRRRVHTCQFCTKYFKKPSDLVRHVRTHTKEKPFKCDVCVKSFTVKSTLKTHLKTHSGVKDYQCHVCQKFFSTSNSLRIHLRQHTGNKPYECGLCPKRFFTSSQRNKHFKTHTKKAERKKKAKPSDLELQTISLPEPLLITDKGLVQLPSFCSDPFGQLESFQQGGSSLERPYKCGFCERAFKKCSHLKLHIRIHTGDRPYGCDQCAKSFMSSGGLKAHLSTHTGEKAFKCEICETSFTRNSSLNRHMITHSDARPFMCPCCEKTFKALRNCKKHMKTHKRRLFEARKSENKTSDFEVIG